MNVDYNLYPGRFGGLFQSYGTDLKLRLFGVFITGLVCKHIIVERHKYSTGKDTVCCMRHYLGLAPSRDDFDCLSITYTDRGCVCRVQGDKIISRSIAGFLDTE